jgi:uncharacterized membrane protein
MIDDPESITFKESHLRSLVKSVVYRILSISGTGILTWFITKDVGKTLSITFATQIFLIVLFYLSERAWNQINWGKKLHSTKKVPKY